MEIRRILVIQTGGIAEVMFSTPAAAALRKRFPEAHISFLVHPERKALLEKNPDISEILVKDTAADLKSPKRFMNIANELKGERFDLCVNLQGLSHYDLLARLANIKLRLNERKKTPFDHMEHTVERHLRLLSSLEIKEPNPKLSLKSSSLSDSSVQDLIEDLGIDTQKKLLGIHIGGSQLSRPQNAQSYASIINELIVKHNLGVALLGGKNELPLAEKILKLTDHKPYNLVNQLSLSELVSMIKRLDLYIGAESGPLQIAAAFSVPVVALFTSRLVKPVQRAPWGSRHIILCGDPRSDEILRSADLLLSGRGRARPQENKKDWLKNSFSILLAFDRRDRDEAAEGQRIFEELCCEGFQIETLDQELQTVKEILDNLEQHDINLMHKLSRKSADYRLSLALSLAWSRIPIPILSVNSKDRKLYGAGDILDYYTEELEKTGKA
jgi:ADP-heptose:LPS heptosyltransferase